MYDGLVATDFLAITHLIWLLLLELAPEQRHMSYLLKPLDSFSNHATVRRECGRLAALRKKHR